MLAILGPSRLDNAGTELKPAGTTLKHKRHKRIFIPLRRAGPQGCAAQAKVLSDES